MLLPFDPKEIRDFWLEVGLKLAGDSKPPAPDDHRPPGVAHFARVSYSARRSSEFVEGYLIGLSKELRPIVEAHVAWMESEPEPDLLIYTEQGFTYEGWLDSVKEWRQALGLCKWLSRGGRTFSDLASAAVADWQVLELASPALKDQARASRRNYMDDHLALTLAADAPLIGLKIYDAAGMKTPMEAATSPVRFGHWACQRLVDRGIRDQVFVSRGREMLNANMLSRFCEGGGDLVQAALWLKAIYFDSGVAQTPEQTFARAYDSMPDVRQPDFINA
jgi:hypothetical protein